MEDHKKEKERNENIVPESSSEKNEQENKLVNSPGSEQSGDFKQHRPLFDAVGRGKWDTAKTYLDQHPDAVRARSNASNNTPLHTAVSAGHLHIVEELVQLLTKEDLLIQQMDGFTVLALSIRTGDIPIAKCLIRKNRELVTVVHKIESLPVVHAVIVSHFQMARYLYSVTPREALTFRDNDRIGANLIVNCILRNIFDTPLDLLEHCPGLAITADQYNQSPVWTFSCRPKSVLLSGCQLGFWQRWVYDRIDIAGCTPNQVTIDLQNQEFTQIDKTDLTAIRSDVKVMYERKLLHVQTSELLSRMCRVIESSSDENQVVKKGRVREAIREAVYMGNVEFIMKVTKANPELVWTNDLAFDVFMLAIELRHAEIFSLIYGLPDKQAIASLHDAKRNNMLHKAASIPSSKTLNLIPGAALQMQRQLQWFKVISSSSLIDSIHSSWREQSRYRIPDIQEQKFVQAFHNIRCNVTVFVSNIIVNVSRNPHITLCRRRFPQILAYQDDDRPLYPFFLHCNHDDCLLCCALFDASGQMDCSYCQLTCKHSSYLVCLDSVSAAS
ncbi:hypothetical protein TIFTF001_012995 [Ficus carica]|uniref:Uncharacterized protein n=1 Tax=Ficus carica TaxID=3494 RepID=A0AA88ADD9_FICCA|nr:hypothetical protein TIFTF001_012995 [Ficus carica]